MELGNWLEKSAAESCEEAKEKEKGLKYLMDKHEGRETFEQEEEESPKEQKLEEKLHVEKHASFLNGFTKRAHKLHAKERNALPESDFALSGRRYPIEDKNHARDAEARASGKPEEGKVRAAVHAKYPGMEQEK